MRSLRGARGFALVDVVVAMVLLAAVLGITAPLSRRIIARYRLNSAVQTLGADISQAKIHAIQTNSIVTLRRESVQLYRVSGQNRELPGTVRFRPESVDSVAFNGLGALAGTPQGLRRFVLANDYGDTREVRLYGAGGYEIR